MDRCSKDGRYSVTISCRHNDLCLPLIRLLMWDDVLATVIYVLRMYSVLSGKKSGGVRHSLIILLHFTDLMMVCACSR